MKKLLTIILAISGYLCNAQCGGVSGTGTAVHCFLTTSQTVDFSAATTINIGTIDAGVWNGTPVDAVNYVSGLSTVATSGLYSDLSGKPTIPTNTNQLTNGSGFITASSSDALTNKTGNISQWTNNSGYLTSVTFPGNNNATGYSSGTVYTLTTSMAKVDFGTTDPAVTIPSAGTYLIYTNIKIEYSGLTTSLNSCSFKLRRTNNTAADLPSAVTSFNVPAATLLTGTGGDVDIPVIIYTTSNSNDAIELQGSRSSGLSLGAINVGEASVVAIRIY